MKLLRFLSFVLLLSGCASTQMYSWGGYQDQLYNYYDQPEQRINVIARMEKHVAYLEAKNMRVPPGLYAEIGTFYLELGDQIRAVEFYKKEGEAWPESQALMTALIKNLETRTVKEESTDVVN